MTTNTEVQQGCKYIMTPGSVCNKCGRIHTEVQQGGELPQDERGNISGPLQAKDRQPLLAFAASLGISRDSADALISEVAGKAYSNGVRDVAPEAFHPTEAQLSEWLERHDIHPTYRDAFYDAASLYLTAQRAASVPAQGAKRYEVKNGDAWEEVAREQYARCNPNYRRITVAPVPAASVPADLHDAIMRLPAKPKTEDLRGTSDTELRAYQIGHRDARHAAAELAAAASVPDAGLSNVDEVIRMSDQSVRIRFASARAASEFERYARAAAPQTTEKP